MRYVNKDLNNIPPSLISEETLEAIEKIAKGAKDIISARIYKGDYKGDDGRSQSRVRDILNLYYKSKCAYCEQTCKAEIEHYRPKKGVTEDSEHEGYYWLCYTWSNLVPSCRYCNTEGGKGNRFPIINEANRVKKPSFNSENLDTTKCAASQTPLIDEKPFLLHPEIDKNPEDHLEFKISDDRTGIEIVGIDSAKRGKTTIKICNLNRNDLKINRLESVYYNMKQRINDILYLNSQNILPDENIEAALVLVYKEIEQDSENETLTHTLLRKFLIKNAVNFENHFSPYLENDASREIAVQAFRNYKS